MKLKTYETPEVEILWVNTEVNFCTSGETNDLSDFNLLDQSDIDWLF
jgi:hypothetical protein